MSSVLESKPVSSQDNLAEKLTFQTKLQGVTNKIHATNNIDEMMLELSQDICNLFNADRMTLYMVSEDKSSIVSKIKTGLGSFKDLKLPIAEQSVAGFVAVNKNLLNIRDVYDDRELKSYSPQLNFLKQVDVKTGYRTKQMLAAPVLDSANKELIGVVQLINTKNGSPFSQVMEEGATHLCETLAIAFRQRQKPASGGMLVRGKYDALVTNAVLSGEELELATRSARRKNLDIETVLMDEFQVKSPAIGEALAAYFGVAYEPFKSDRVKPIDLLKNMSREFVESSGWIPIDDGTEGLIVLTTDPEKVKSSRVVNNVYPKHKIVYKVCGIREFASTLDQLFGGGSADDSVVTDDFDVSMLSEGDEGGEEGVQDVASAASDNELVKLVNKVIVDAYNQNVSDIHIEPYPGKEKTVIRFRKDGALRNYIEVPAAYRNALAARIKIMCDLDISERRKPQDGKIKFKRFGPLDIELRVATIPTQGGVEDIVMRILAASKPMPLEKLGLSKRNYEVTKDAVSKPYGLFFVCGPTGSGKTTTLHSVLGYLNTPEKKIWTAEDPVEITQYRLRQVQMNPKAGLTFAVAMKAFLRANPDIIMVGEMRDAETTGTGIEASLTGHLVFATLHTNSAPEAVIRLLDMGMDPFNFSDALLGILAQRLVPTLCANCKTSHVATQAELDTLMDEYAVELMKTETWKKDAKAARAKQMQDWVATFGNEKGEITLCEKKEGGCEKCEGSGYKGRAGMHEVLIGTTEVKKLIQKRAPVEEIFATAVEQGMRTLKQDGIERVLSGKTDIHKVRAVAIK